MQAESLYHVCGHPIYRAITNGSVEELILRDVGFGRWKRKEWRKRVVNTDITRYYDATKYYDEHNPFIAALAIKQCPACFLELRDNDLFPVNTGTIQEGAKGDVQTEDQNKAI